MNWQRRFFTSTRDALHYYTEEVVEKGDDAHSGVRKGSISWVDIRAVIEKATSDDHPQATEKDAFYFVICISEKKKGGNTYRLLLQAKSEVERSEWASHIRLKLNPPTVNGDGAIPPKSAPTKENGSANGKKVEDKEKADTEERNQAMYSSRLQTFFLFYNDTMIPEIEGMLKTHKGREEELLKGLIAQYGPEPEL